MRKYPSGESYVGAVYDNAPVDNPFLAAMPEMLSHDDFSSEIRSFPKLPVNLSSMTNEERRQVISLLTSIFIPMDYMYSIYDQLYRAIRVVLPIEEFAPMTYRPGNNPPPSDPSRFL